MEDDRRKTKTEMGRHQEKLLVAAECKSMEGTNREHGYLEMSY